MISDKLTAWVRTAVPILIGVALTWVATKTGIVLDGNTTAYLATAVTGVIIAVYYTLVRWLESRWPQLGWLLGAAKAPVYAAPADVVHVNGVLRSGSTE